MAPAQPVAPRGHSRKSESGESVRAAVGSLHYSPTWRTGLVWGRQDALQTKQFTLIQHNTGSEEARARPPPVSREIRTSFCWFGSQCSTNPALHPFSSYPDYCITFLTLGTLRSCDIWASTRPRSRADGVALVSGGASGLLGTEEPGLFGASLAQRYEAPAGGCPAPSARAATRPHRGSPQLRRELWSSPRHCNSGPHTLPRACRGF